jgi:DNA-binding MarR family transcriptional regulator
MRWQRAMRAALATHGLTHVQFVLLASAWWLGEQGERPSQRRLAEHAGTDAMMTSQVVRALERAGLVKRVRDPDDSRSLLVAVTDAGRAGVREALADVEAADTAFFAPVHDAALVPRCGRRRGGKGRRAEDHGGRVSHRRCACQRWSVRRLGGWAGQSAYRMWTERVTWVGLAPVAYVRSSSVRSSGHA